MGKLCVRLSIAIVAVYLSLAYIMAQFFGVDILTAYYVLLFELCVTVYCFSEGKYHCKYMKSTMLGILLSDVVTLLDNSYDFLTVEAHNLIPLFIIASGIIVSISLAIRHFVLVIKLRKRAKYDSAKRIAN